MRFTLVRTRLTRNWQTAISCVIHLFFPLYRCLARSYLAWWGESIGAYGALRERTHEALCVWDFEVQ